MHIIMGLSRHVEWMDFGGITFLGSVETKLRIVTKPSHLVSNRFCSLNGLAGRRGCIAVWQ